MMANYVRTAAGLMDRASRDMAYAPVDYAVSQKVLPTLSGAQGRLGSLLEELAGVGGLPLTSARARHMLEVGNDSGYYQFFA